MTVDLFGHQFALNQECRVALRGVKSVLIQGATGIGKSRMATAQIFNSQLKNKIAAFVVPKRDLVRQMSATFSQFDIDHSFVVAGYRFNPSATVFIATVGTLIKRLHKINPHVIFIDETHWGGKDLDKIINYFKARGCYVVGLSATPKKMSGQGMGMWYDKMVCGPSIRWLIDNKYLSDYEMFAPDSPDLSNIDTVAGDYAKGQLADFMEKNNVLVGSAVNHYKAHAMGKLNVVFTTSLKHNEIVAASFNAAGIPAASIDGTMKDWERKKIIQAFARRELLCLCSVDLMHTGFDLSSAAGMDVTVESMSDLRPTQSLPLQMQKWGRVLRYKKFPAIIFDHANNWKKHGFPCDERQWTLDSSPKRKKVEDVSDIKIRQCPRCFRVERPSSVCVGCGHVFEIKSRQIEEIDGDLKKIDMNAIKEKRKQEFVKARTYEELLTLAISRKNPQPEEWAAQKIQERKEWKAKMQADRWHKKKA